MRSKFERLSKPELDFLLDNCNFSEEECTLLRFANIGYSEVQIAEKLNVSTSSVTKKKKQIVCKIKSFLEVAEKMTTIYVDGKRVTREELGKYEIQIETVKKILSEKLTVKK